MRVCIVTDEIAGLASGAAGDLLGSSFAARGAQVAVIPAAEDGDPLLAALRRIDATIPVVSPQSAEELTGVLAQPRPEPWVLDLTRYPGGVPESGLEVGLEEAMRVTRVASQPGLLAIAPDAQLSLTGMSGAIADTGRREQRDLAETLRLNGRAERWLAEIGVSDAPGAGASHGWGALVLAAGGQVLTGVEACLQLAHSEAAFPQADLLITGAHTMDFASVGGPVVREMTARARTLLTPLIAVAGYNYISARELRLLGIEAAYAVASDAHSRVDEASLQALADRLATTWRW